jgi:hypothetical protein
LQAPFPGAPQFCHPAPFNMTPSLQPSSAATQAYLCYGPSWQGYDFHHGGYSGPPMFPPQQFTGQGPSSPGTPRVPPAPPQNHPVIWPSSSNTTPYRQLARPTRKPPKSPSHETISASG